MNLVHYNYLLDDPLLKMKAQRGEDENFCFKSKEDSPKKYSEKQISRIFSKEILKIFSKIFSTSFDGIKETFNSLRLDVVLTQHFIRHFFLFFFD